APVLPEPHVDRCRVTALEPLDDHEQHPRLPAPFRFRVGVAEVARLPLGLRAEVWRLPLHETPKRSNETVQPPARRTEGSGKPSGRPGRRLGLARRLPAAPPGHATTAPAASAARPVPRSGANPGRGVTAC